jgi:hypothetical protein
LKAFQTGELESLVCKSAVTYEYPVNLWAKSHEINTKALTGSEAAILHDVSLLRVTLFKTVDLNICHVRGKISVWHLFIIVGVRIILKCVLNIF